MTAALPAWMIVAMLAGGPVLNAVLVLIGLRMFRLKVSPVALREEFAAEFGEYQERVDHRFAYIDRQLARLGAVENQLKVLPRDIEDLTRAVQELSVKVTALGRVS